MKKTNSNQFTPLLLLLLLLTITVHKAASLTTTAAAAEGCNSTRIGDCLTDDDEFLMESETTRRLLTGPKNTIAPLSKVPTKSFCNRDVYGSCPGQPNSYYTKRACDYSNHCHRAA